MNWRHEAALRAALPAFLQRQRWFGSKARTITSCQLGEVAAIAPDGTLVLVAPDLAYADGARERYALLVSVRADPGGLPVIDRADPEHQDWLVEAATDPASVKALLRGLTRASKMTPGPGVLRYGDASAIARQVLADDSSRISPVGAEQSNTSVRVGPSLVFKLFRRLEPGENPELEISRFLTTHTAFRATPGLHGSLTYAAPGETPATLGVLQDWVEGDGDGWRYVLHRLRAPRTAAADRALRDDLEGLGRITAQCHAALASGTAIAAFAPEPLEAADLTSWHDGLRARAERMAAVIASHRHGWADPTRELADRVLGCHRHLTQGAIPAGPAGFLKIRVHGDYHLGQTLHTPSGFVLVDFEGEPARPIAERRLKQSALKDVAGMLRSFDYAVETACQDEPATAERMRAHLDLSGAFLDGYRAAAGEHAPWLPAGVDAFDQWLRFFTLDKAFYELEYEVNNRPAWVHIPLRGILRVAGAHEEAR